MARKQITPTDPFQTAGEVKKMKAGLYPEDETFRDDDQENLMYSKIKPQRMYNEIKKVFDSYNNLMYSPYQDKRYKKDFIKALCVGQINYARNLINQLLPKCEKKSPIVNNFHKKLVKELKEKIKKINEN